MNPAAPGTSGEPAGLRPSLADVQTARARLRGVALRTPLVPLGVEVDGATVLLKLESLQPIGSFKLRGAGNALAAADPASLVDGVWTASAGNMAQGVAWCARRLGVACAVVVPEHAPAAKTDAIGRLGGSVERVPFPDWWRILVERGRPGTPGVFVHPVSDPLVIAGNGTIGLEILEDAPEVDTVVVPYGGGGLSCGIAAALAASGSHARVLAAEVDTAAPLAASLAAGGPATIDYAPSFVDGIGSGGLLEEMWPLASDLLAGSVPVPVAEVAAAVRTLAVRNRVVAEGAGATGVAAVLSGRVPGRTIVVVVSGGNIDSAVLARILQGADG